jgi:hypothetical protein
MEEAGIGWKEEGGSSRLTAERVEAAILSEVWLCEARPYEAERSLHNRALRRAEVIVWKQSCFAEAGAEVREHTVFRFRMMTS